ncbi:MAG: chemotaxis protein CheY [Sulfuricurvum sp. PC08-66]|nr:MAG: chemotaxis protein CheY [Sulfuricurvum sp. PC08-66]
MGKPLVIVVEDQEDLLEVIEYNLTKAGYEVMGFLNTKKLSQAFEQEEVALIIMDRNLPGVEGSEFIQAQRAKGMDIPVLFLSAKTKSSEIEEGFERGGDDYLTKPFNMNELLLRVKAILKRTNKTPVNDQRLSYRDIEIDLAQRSVLVGDVPVELTKLEFDLLSTFVQNKNVVLDRDFLLENVWKSDDFFQDRTVNVAINRLKEKIDPTKEKTYFKTIRGVGYTLC